MPQRSLTPKDLAKKIAAFAAEKKAEAITILDMRDVVNFCDYFVICSGTSERQVVAIANGIDEGLEDLGLKVQYRQGLPGSGRSGRMSGINLAEAQGAWILLDMGDVVTHIFEPQSREFYGLEYLWRDAKRVSTGQRLKKAK